MAEMPVDDIIELEQLLARYAVAATKDDVEGVMSVFTDDGTYSAFGDVYAIPDFPRLFQAAPSGLFHTGTPHVDLDVEAGTGTGEQTLLFIDQTNHHMRMGWYTDTYRRTDDGWRLATRKMTFLRRSGERDSGKPHDPNRPEASYKAADGVSDDTRPSAEEIVLYDKDPSTKVATLTLDRPDELNAMTVDAMHRFADLVRQASVDDDVKVLVIRANGPHLGSGADLTELLDIMAGRGDVGMNHVVRVPDDAEVIYPPKGSYRYGATNVQNYTDPSAGIRSLQDFKKISILEVRGYCYGWHFYLAADADIVVSADDALFGHAAWRYAGFAPRMWQWCEMMGVRKFMEMVFTGRPFTAAEMADCDFVNAVAPFDELEALTEKYALACARTRPTDTVFAQKTFFEMYKQHQGEYMGSIMSALMESVLRQLKPDPDSWEMDRDEMDKGVANSVRDNDEQFPPEWRLSQRGRGGDSA